MYRKAAYHPLRATFTAAPVAVTGVGRLFLPPRCRRTTCNNVAAAVFLRTRPGQARARPASAGLTREVLGHPDGAGGVAVDGDADDLERAAENVEAGAGVRRPLVRHVLGKATGRHFAAYAASSPI